MKYSVEIIVDAPRSKFVDLMDDAENMKHWQRGFLGYEQVEGKMGEVGAKMKMRYIERGKEMELVETIIKSDFPSEFHASYDMPGMSTIQKNYLSESQDGKTIWRSDCEFTSDKFMFKMMMTLMPFVFKNQSRKMMNDFKAFVENGTSVEGL